MVPCKANPDALKQTCFAIYHQVQPSIFPDHLRMPYQAQPNKFVLLQEKKKLIWWNCNSGGWREIAKSVSLQYSFYNVGSTNSSNV